MVDKQSLAQDRKQALQAVPSSALLPQKRTITRKRKRTVEKYSSARGITETLDCEIRPLPIIIFYFLDLSLNHDLKAFSSLKNFTRKECGICIQDDQAGVRSKTIYCNAKPQMTDYGRHQLYIPDSLHQYPIFNEYRYRLRNLDLKNDTNVMEKRNLYWNF